MNEDQGKRPDAGIRAFFSGRVRYKEAWVLQQRLWEERAGGRLKDDVLLFLDHEPVFTLGKGGAASNILAKEAPDGGGEVPVIRVNRGGEVTFHGPGQLMLYAICDLRERDRDVHRHCRRLEEVFLRYVEGLGLAPARRPEMPGLWVEGEKILALGVGARRWVTLHGVAFNVSPDLRFFEMMHPCGEVGGRATSLGRLLGEAPPLRKVVEDLLQICAGVFGDDVSMSPDLDRLFAPAAGVAGAAGG